MKSPPRLTSNLKWREYLISFFYHIKNNIKKGFTKEMLCILSFFSATRWYAEMRKKKKSCFVKPETREIVFVKPANEGLEGDVLQPAEAFLPPPSRESTVWCHGAVAAFPIHCAGEIPVQPSSTSSYSPLLFFADFCRSNSIPFLLRTSSASPHHSFWCLVIGNLTAGDRIN